NSQFLELFPSQEGTLPDDAAILAIFPRGSRPIELIAEPGQAYSRQCVLTVGDRPDTPVTLCVERLGEDWLLTVRVLCDARAATPCEALFLEEQDEIRRG